MGKFVDLTGRKFGKLTVIKRDDKEKGVVKWLCQCECGNYHVTKTYNLLHGLCKSCGCMNPFKNPECNPKKQVEKNRYDLSGDYGIGYTAQGKMFYFDLEDYDKIKGCYWFINCEGYVQTSSYRNSKIHRPYMHRVIMNVLDNPEVLVDHIYHNKTDNRKSQLRLVNAQQNAANNSFRKNNTSGFKGVYWHEPSGKWEALIQYKNKLINLGLYSDISDAVKARKAAEIKYFGEYRYRDNEDVFNDT